MLSETLKKSYHETTTRISEKTAILASAAEEYCHGFFKPYTSVGDFMTTVVTVVSYPIAFAVLTGIAGIAAFIFALGSLVATLLGGVVYGFNEELGSDMLAVGLDYALISLAAAAGALVSAVLTFVSGPAQAVSILAKAGATLAEQLGCCEPEEDPASLNNSFSLFPS